MTNAISPDSGISPTDGSNHTKSPIAETFAQDTQSLREFTVVEDDGSTPPNQSNEPSDHAPIAKNACFQCRGRKSKCSGQQPVCQTCSVRNLNCTWDTEPQPQTGSSSPTAKRKSRSSADANQQGRPKRSQGSHFQVRSACTRCQKRKAKCTGQRPTCQFCLDRGLECVYDVEDGSTRTEDLKKKLEESRERTHDLDRLVAMLRNSSDQDSTTMLARLRLGDPLEDLFEAVRNESSPADNANPLP